jgi:hypothetical protein
MDNIILDAIKQRPLFLGFDLRFDKKQKQKS